MKWIILISVVLIGVGAWAYVQRKMAPKQLIAQDELSFYELKVDGLEGGQINMADFKGKYVLCVNVASKCGYTPQYKELQQLSEQYKENLVVIGFPCNQFLFQEPGSAEEIATFCERNYGVTFPLSAKLDVKGRDQHPVYQWLTRKSLNGVADVEISWNFQKILISPEGVWLRSFEPKVNPLSTEITELIR